MDTVTIGLEKYNKMVEELRLLRDMESEKVERLEGQISELLAGKTMVKIKMWHRIFDRECSEFYTDEKLAKKIEELTIARDEAISKYHAVMARNLFERIINKDQS